MTFTNTGLVIRLVVAAVFLLAGLLLMRGRSRQRDAARGVPLGAVLITVGGALFLVGELYGMFVLRPFIGRFFDDEWHVQVDIVDALSTLGLLFCAGGLVIHALRKQTGRPTT